jgi:hypothetical protein
MKQWSCALALALLTAAPQTSGTDRLFPTDVPEAREVDASLSAGYARSTSEDSDSETEFTSVFEILQLRAGLGTRFALGAVVPYLSSGEVCFRSSSSDLCEDLDAEWGSASVFADYQIAGHNGSPFSAKLHLQYDTNSDADENDGFDVSLAGGWALDSGLKAFALLGRKMPNADFASDSWRVGAGLFAGPATVRVVPEVSYARFDATDFIDAYASYRGTLSALIALTDRVTLSPGVGYTRIEPPDSFGPDETAAGWDARLTVYSLFGGAKPKPAATRRVASAKAVTTPKAVPPIAEPAGAQPPPATAEPVAGAVAAPPVAESGTSTLQAGPWTLSQAAALYPAPRADAAATATLDAGTTVQLKKPIRNAAGAWWYVDGLVKGWIREPDLR